MITDPVELLSPKESLSPQERANAQAMQLFAWVWFFGLFPKAFRRVFKKKSLR